MDRTKESLFNILDNRLDWENTRVLDLFAGTGNISLEAASRGALQVVSVDKHPGCAGFIRKTAAELGFTQLEVVCRDALGWQGYISGSFDFIFLDPPYHLSGQAALISGLINSEFLAPGGILILEHAVTGDYRQCPGYTETRKYGQSAFSFFNKPEAI